ncbi:MAG: hypothetical protein AAFV96_12255, partial [Pseudomonadota bacterium]
DMARKPDKEPAKEADGTESRRLTRRGILLFGVQLAVAGTLAWRMRELQIVNAEHYRHLAEENRINLRLMAPARAEIFDRNGVPLAVNRQNYRVVMVREQAGDEAEVDPVLFGQRAVVFGLLDLELAHAPGEPAGHAELCGE